MNNYSLAKPDPFFWDEPDFGPKIWVVLGRVGLQSKKTQRIEIYQDCSITVYSTFLDVTK